MKKGAALFNGKRPSNVTNIWFFAEPHPALLRRPLSKIKKGATLLSLENQKGHYPLFE